ncbi:4'-phosphopantetheinyl transferase superfamily protein [Herbaspirillum lusitanum]|uniref:4'-phosphopantetheinyl transferase superfamily protein n=1 Tax=Herbaspirillum lusitanum TaxID=213312 RepID=A0ABW9AB82_9BURK
MRHRRARSERLAISLTPSVPPSIDLWYCPEAAVDGSLLAQYRQLLTPGELERMQQLRGAALQRRYLLTRALQRTVLSRYLPLAPAMWRFSFNACGKPQITDALFERYPAARALSFNLAHTEGMILMGVMQGGQVGVDIELARNDFAVDDIAAAFFAASERTALANLPEAERRRRFYCCWTLKEAFLKACGCGLSRPLSLCAFDFPDAQTIGFIVDPAMSRSAECNFDADETAASKPALQFWQIPLAGAYIVSICAVSAPSAPHGLTLREMIPLASECVVAIKEVASSASSASSVFSASSTLQAR